MRERRIHCFIPCTRAPDARAHSTCTTYRTRKTPKSHALESAAANLSLSIHWVGPPRPKYLEPRSLKCISMCSQWNCRITMMVPTVECVAWPPSSTATAIIARQRNIVDCMNSIQVHFVLDAMCVSIRYALVATEWMQAHGRAHTQHLNSFALRELWIVKSSVGNYLNVFETV